MAFATADLELMAGGGASTRMWSYVTAADAKATVDTAGYFNSAAGQLRVGDWLFIKASDGYGISVVSANSGTVVDIDDMLAVGGTDTD